ncbi:MAG: hypothetical protein NTU44_19965, partial [Bacteroidetes bacterium]|nr:hypothetical protein [Bacteroidota bacterium]
MDIPSFNPLLTQVERQLLISKYRHLLSLCRPYFKPGDTNLMRQAFNLAFWASHEKKSVLNEPAIYYTIDLTEILAVETGLGTD